MAPDRTSMVLGQEKGVELHEFNDKEFMIKAAKTDLQRRVKVYKYIFVCYNCMP